MTDEGRTGGVRFTSLETAGDRACCLVAHAGTDRERRFAFRHSLEIGRDEEGRKAVPGLLLIRDPVISRRHCILSRTPDGRCFVRDVSRNGVRLDGRRLVPNVETEIRPGQTLAVGTNHHFILDGDLGADTSTDNETEGGTIGAPGRTIATVLVGDIRDYTVLVRRVSPAALQRSVSRVFEILTAGVVQLGGTVKEYQGDAILAFWEGTLDGAQAIKACGAALELDRIARRIAADSRVWQVRDFPLMLDWALATGPVLIDTFGGRRPQGLSLVGEPVVLAFRLEKLAGDHTGPILACAATQAMTGATFTFRDLGEMNAKGFDRADHVFALQDR